MPSEVQAAVFAADRLCASSPSFASTLATQVASLVYALETPAKLKVQLVALVRHFHHDAAGVASGVQLCKMLIAAFPAKPMVLALLNSATHLVSVSQIGVVEHIGFLLGCLKQDVRAAVQACALAGLHRMACRAPSSWSSTHVAEIVDFVDNSPVPKLVHDGLRVCSGLAGTTAGTAVVAELLVAEGGKALDALQALSGHPSADVSISAAVVLSKVGCAGQLPAGCTPHRERLIEVACEAVATAVACWIVPSSSLRNSTSPTAAPTSSPPAPAASDANANAMATEGDDDLADLSSPATGAVFSAGLPCLDMLKELLACPTRLAAVSAPAGAALVDVLVAQLETLTAGPLDVAAGQSLQRILAVRAAGGTAAGAAAAAERASKVLSRLGAVVASAHHRVEARVEAAVAAMVCSTIAGNTRSTGGKQALAHMDAAAADLAASGENWAVYRLARQAASLGSHSSARQAFDAIRNCPASEHFTFWIASLSHLCSAEEICSAGSSSSVAVAKQLAAATGTFHASRTALKAAVQPKQQFKFQLDYVEFRIEMTATLLDTIKCIGNISRRGGAVVPGTAVPCFDRLHKLVLQCVALERGYSDVDHASMVLLDALRDALGSIANAFGRILAPSCAGKLTPQLLPSPAGGATAAGHAAASGNPLALLAGRLVLELDEHCPEGSTTSSPQSRRWLQEAVVELASSPQPVPRFFFWNGTPTTIQMFLTQDADAAGTIEIPPDTDFVFVVEGVVRAGGPVWKTIGSSSQDSRSREVAEAVLDVRIQPKGGSATAAFASSSSSSFAGGGSGGGNVLAYKRDVAVHKNSFRTTFLIKLPVKTPGSAGAFEAVVVASLLDASGRLWTTSATSTLALAVQADKVRRA